MKKLSLILTCALFAAGSSYAQKSLVETVNKTVESYDSDFRAARTQLQPALTNEETKDNAQTWFVAGKIEYGLYDQLLGKKQLKQPVDDAEMGTALLDGYKYYVKALELDSVPERKKDGTVKTDKKGNVKVKTKYSKDIVSNIAGHYNDYSDVASIFYDAKDFKKAFECWEIFTTLPKSTMLGNKTPFLPDTIIGQVQFFQGIAAWQAEDNKKAIESFKKAISNGYVKKEVYDYALSNYVALNDNEGIVAVAEQALPLFGNEDSQYISILINNYINKGEFDKATEMLDKAIAANPTNAEFYDVKGTLYENKKDNETALTYFKKAIELNPEYAKGYFDVGRYYYNKAVKVNEGLDKNLTATELAKAFDEQIKPLYREALPYMEKAYQLDSTNSDVKHALRNIYYLLGMEAELNALEQAM